MVFSVLFAFFISLIVSAFVTIKMSKKNSLEGKDVIVGGISGIVVYNSIVFVIGK